jgi:hypothetical protein
MEEEAQGKGNTRKECKAASAVSTSRGRLNSFLDIRFLVKEDYF